MPPIPWFDFSGARFAGFSIFAWAGIAAAAAGTIAAIAAARRTYLGVRFALPAFVLIGALGALGAHVMAVVAYHFDLFAEAPLKLLLDVMNGAASTGGLLGGLAGALLAARLAKLPASRILDPASVGAVVGFAVGRIGCALVHDHPGIAFPYFPALAFPGGPRLDLGLVECAFAFVLARPVVSGLALGHGVASRRFLVGYGAYRFAADFLRIGAEEAAPLIASGLVKSTDVDPRHFGLTPGQYAAAVLVAAGLMLRRTGPLTSSPPPTR